MKFRIANDSKIYTALAWDKTRYFYKDEFGWYRYVDKTETDNPNGIQAIKNPGWRRGNTKVVMSDEYN